MLSIFQSHNNSLDLRTIICRFNIISYGSFLLVYPILLFTNLNQWLFIGMSLIFLPQIYVNAQKGIRPDLNHPYYSKFLMFRFIIVVKYFYYIQVLRKRFPIQCVLTKTWLRLMFSVFSINSSSSKYFLIFLVLFIMDTKDIRPQKDIP